MVSRREWLSLVAGAGECWAQSAATGGTRFLSWDDVKPIAPLLNGNLNSREWPAYIERVDRTVRDRAQRGVEDSVSQVLLFGTSHTLLPRLRGAEAALTREGALTPPAMSRLKALVGAMAGEPRLDRLRLAQRALGLQGRSAEEMESRLTANLIRFVREEGQSDSQRGLSPDALLLPNFAVEEVLRVLPPGKRPRVQSIAVVGPGLDVVDRRYGYDFYPLQTLQPYAILEAAARLNFGPVESMSVTSFDLNPGVLDLIRRQAEEARAGRSRPLALLGDPHLWTPALVRYWRNFGMLTGTVVNDWIGRKAPPDLELRTVSIRPEVVAHMHARDVNIVAQVEAMTFDLLVATNILNYYAQPLQSLALCAVARMLRPGGVFVTNTPLAGPVPSSLHLLASRRVHYTVAGDLADEAFVFQRE